MPFATGFSGLVGSYAKLAANLPLLVTEHGIYTNERRTNLPWPIGCSIPGRRLRDRGTDRIALDLVECISMLLAGKLCGGRCHNNSVPRQSEFSAHRRRAG